MDSNGRQMQSRRTALKDIATVLGAGVIGTSTIPTSATAVDYDEKLDSEVNNWYEPIHCINGYNCRQQMATQNTNILWRGVESVGSGYRYRDLHHFTVIGYGAVRRRYTNRYTNGWTDWGMRRLANPIDTIGFELELTGSVSGARIDFSHYQHDGVVAPGVPQGEATSSEEFVTREVLGTIIEEGMTRKVPDAVPDAFTEYASESVTDYLVDRLIPDYYGPGPADGSQLVRDEWTIDDVDEWIDFVTEYQSAMDLQIALDFVVDAPYGTDVDDLGLKARTYVRGGPRADYNNGDLGDHGATKVFNTTTSEDVPIGL